MIRRFSCLPSLLWVAIIPVEWGTRRDARKPWDGGQGRGGGGSPCTGSAPRLPPPLQLPTQQTSTRQFIRRGALRGEKWKKQNRKRWREAGESESYIIGQRTTNRKRKRAALMPPVQRFISAWQPESLRQGFGFKRWHLPACNFQLLPRPGEANSQLERQNESVTVKFDLTHWLHYLPPLLWLSPRF